MRLFCLPYAGGGAAVYRLWEEDLPPGVELCRVQLPGRESRLREQPYNRIPALIDALLPAMAPLLDRPFALFGHSMGALVAFELCRAMRGRMRVAPERLFASGWRAPHLPLGTALHAMPDAEFIDKLRERFDGIPEGVLREPELLAMMLPILRADLAVCETYAYQSGEPFDFPITVLGGTRDHWISPADLAGWSLHSRHEIDIHMFPGRHFFLNEERQSVVRTVASALGGIPAERRVRA